MNIKSISGGRHHRDHADVPNGQKGKNDVNCRMLQILPPTPLTSIGTNLKKDGLNELNLRHHEKGMADDEGRQPV